jgi:hypothetical protein
MRSGSRPALCAGALLALRGAAIAGEPPAASVDVTWSAPPECPTEPAVRASVLGLLGRSQPPAGAPPIPVRMTASRSAQGTWSVRIEIEHPGSAAPHERHLDGDTCAEVADAAAVVTALAIAPSLATLPPEKAPAAPATPKDPPPDRAAAPSRSPKLRPGLRVLGGADFASLPSPAPGAVIGAVLLLGDNRFEILAAGWFPMRATSAARSTAGGNIGLLTGGARYCRTFLQLPVELAGCAGFEAGALIGGGFGVQQPATSTSPWFAPGLGLLGLYPISPAFALALGVDGLVPVARGAFALDGLGEVYRAPSISGRALGGVELRFR